MSNHENITIEYCHSGRRRQHALRKEMQLNIFANYQIMNLNNSSVSIVDLPEELLINIFNKLHNLDVLYSLIGSNKKLDKIACDRVFTQSIDLTSILSNAKDDSISNRFFSYILPRIHNCIQCLTIDTCFFERILYANKFVNLHRLTLINLDISTASNIFNKTSPFIVAFKYQIYELILTIDCEGAGPSKLALLIVIYHRILNLLSNLRYLDVNVNNNHYSFAKSLLDGLPSTICSSSTITHLSLQLHNIDDCLCLLDGRLNQLQSFIVKLDYIHDPALLRRRGLPLKIKQNSLRLLKKTKHADKLKYFSLHPRMFTSEFDSLLVLLLRRMVHLEELTLSLRMTTRTSFIDGTYLENAFLKQLTHLQRFNFDIVLESVVIDEDIKPSFNDIRRTFIERGYNVAGYMQCTQHFIGVSNQCHIYSLPFPMEYMQPISHSFPGGLFKNVSDVRVRDEHHPFEHSFFLKISQSFPLLRRLTIDNRYEQKQKPEEVSSVIEFPYLTELECRHAHINYVEQFLSDLHTYLPSLIKLSVLYEHLLTITENFTRNTTRTNCAGLKSIKFDDSIMPHSKDFYLYFPSL